MTRPRRPSPLASAPPMPKIKGSEVAKGLGALALLIGINLGIIALIVWVVVSAARWAWGA